jgi:hypothetical protein
VKKKKKIVHPPCERKKGIINLAFDAIEPV